MFARTPMLTAAVTDTVSVPITHPGTRVGGSVASSSELFTVVRHYLRRVGRG